MFRFTPGVAGGLAIGVAAGVATIFTALTSTPSESAAKADRLTMNLSAPADDTRIAVVEVVGVRDTAIVYRDREGRVLFSTDPVANVTVVTKNLALPEVTVREAAQSEIERVPVEKTRAPTNDKPIMQGCESGLSPDISPTVPTGRDRCIVQAEPTSNFASLH